MASEIEFVDRASATLLRHMASDAIVAESARVSTKGAEITPGQVRGTEADRRLIASLMRERHGVPFEHAVFTFAVDAPLFAVQQLLKHRISSISQESGRYREMKPRFYLPAAGRKVAQVGKPMAYDMRDGTGDQSGLVRECLGVAAETAWRRYRAMIDSGITRELARAVLPPTIMTSLVITLNSRSLMNLVSLRTSNTEATYPSHPQREVEMVARDMEDEFSEAMPATYAAFVASGRVAP